MIFRERTTFEKYKEIFYERIIIALKGNKEYKINFWSVVSLDIILFLTYMIFYNFYGQLISEFLNWKSFDYTTFFVIVLTISKLKYMFSLKHFSRFLLKGDLNIYLTKPYNLFFSQILRPLSGAGIISFMFFIFTIFILILNYKNFEQIPLILFIFLFSLFFEFLFHNFLFATAFFVKKNEFLIWEPMFRLEITAERFTPKIFEKMSIFNFFAIMPTAFAGYFIVEILNKRKTEFIHYFPYAVLVSIFLILCLYVIWTEGLKRYEAYG
jgi:ABC-type uncharacterized transport system permease subunit